MATAGPLSKLAQMLVDHLDGILNSADQKVRFGVVSHHATSKPFLEGRGYKNLAYLLLKAQRMAVTQRPNSSFFQKAA